MYNNRACLVIFCKRPALFQGKQRLAEDVGVEHAYKFATAFLECALEDAASWPGPVVLSPATDKDSSWAGTLLRRDHQVMAQPEGCLGHRLRTIDQQLRDQGHSRIIFIGSDAPLLTSGHYEEAKNALDSHDIVLSPASDGGVTVMGSRTGWPDMTGLPWSTDVLGRALENLCRTESLSVKNISPSYDIDVVHDLAKAGMDLTDDPRSARQNLYRLLCDFLKQDRIKYA